MVKIQLSVRLICKLMFKKIFVKGILKLLCEVHGHIYKPKWLHIHQLRYLAVSHLPLWNCEQFKCLELLMEIASSLRKEPQ